MPSTCTAPSGTISRPDTEVLPIPAGSGTLLAAVSVMLSDNDAGPSPTAFSTAPDPFIATPPGWTKIGEARVAASSGAPADDAGLVTAIFSRPYVAGTVQFASISGDYGSWAAAVCALGGGNAFSYIPTAGGVLQVNGPTAQGGVGLSVVTAGIVVPDDDSLLVYVGASPDATDQTPPNGTDDPPAGMTFGVVATEGGIGVNQNISQVQIFWQTLGAAAATGTRTKVYRTVDGDNGDEVGVISTLLAFR